MCLVRPALLYLNVKVLKVLYEQINYYYYCYYIQTQNVAAHCYTAYGRVTALRRSLGTVLSLQSACRNYYASLK